MSRGVSNRKLITTPQVHTWLALGSWEMLTCCVAYMKASVCSALVDKSSRSAALEDGPDADPLDDVIICMRMESNVVSLSVPLHLTSF
jgi:hypothetical protein